MADGYTAVVALRKALPDRISRHPAWRQDRDCEPKQKSRGAERGAGSAKAVHLTVSLCPNRKDAHSHSYTAAESGQAGSRPNAKDCLPRQRRGAFLLLVGKLAFEQIALEVASGRHARRDHPWQHHGPDSRDRIVRSFVSIVTSTLMLSIELGMAQLMVRHTEPLL